MENTKKMLPYLFIVVLDFYLIPFLIKDTGSAMLSLLVIIPIICFICSIIYGVKNSFNLQYSFLVAFLFIPTIFIFYNFSAWIYIVFYGAAALIGNAVGMIFHKR